MIKREGINNLYNIYYGLLLCEYVLSILLISMEVYVIIPLMIVIIFTAFNNKKIEDKLFTNLIFVLLMCLWALMNKEFVFFPQAKTLLDMHTDLLFWIKDGHMHASRLIIAYPGYLISKLCGIPLNEGFGYYCIAVFALLYANLISIQRELKYTKLDMRVAYIVFGIAMLGLSVAMNGRIIFAFLGVSIILLNNIRLSNMSKFSIMMIIKYIIGIFLTTVSSGTMMVGVMTAFCGLIFSHRVKKILSIKWLYLALIPLVPVGYVFGKYVLQMVEKNVDYFGGGLMGIFNMLQHGLGKYLPISDMFSLLCIMLMGLCFAILNAMFVLYAYKKKYVLFHPFLAFNIAVYGSMFGLSTGTTAVVGFLSLIVFFINQKVVLEGKELENYNAKIYN